MPIATLCCLFLHRAGDLSLPLLLLWEGVVSLALVGFGLALLRLLGLRGKPLAVAGCAGVAAWTLLGGWLNLLHAASRGVLFGLVLFGALLGAVELARAGLRARWSAAAACLPASRAGRSAAALLGIYFLLIFAANVRPMVWNEYDDLQAYMPFAEKASLRNTLQGDAFSERRVIGLGSGTFLDVMMLASGDESAMGFVDAGFGYVLFLATLVSVLRAMGLRGGRLIAVMFFVPVFTLGKLNLTIVNLSSAPLLGMLLLFGEDEAEDVRPGLVVRKSVLLGLLLATICTMKSSNIMFVCLFTLLTGVMLSVRSGGARRFGAYLAMVPPALLVVLPWMLASLGTTGTLLFPVLGRGFDASAYGVLPLPGMTAPASQVLLLALPDVLLMLLAGALIFLWNRGLENRGLGNRRRQSALVVACLSFVAAAVVSLPVNGLATAGEALDRYGLPYMSPIALFFFGYLALAWTNQPKARYLRAAAVLAAGWVVFYLLLVSNRERLNQEPGELLALAGRRHPFYGYQAILTAAKRESDAAALARAQNAVPAGAPIIESVASAYAFDWERNPVYVADLPGLGGPPPGMPISDDPEETRQYLLKCGIRYLVLDRSLLSHNFDLHEFLREPMLRVTYPQIARHYIRTRVTATWVRLQAAVSEHTLMIFLELAERGHPVYDDGRLVVVPLQ